MWYLNDLGLARALAAHRMAAAAPAGRRGRRPEQRASRTPAPLALQPAPAPWAR